MENKEEIGTDVGNELVGLAGDPRLMKRSRKMLQKWQERPGLGFPQIFGHDAELEAAYRFFNNRSISFQGLLEPHIEKSIERCKQVDEVLCIQDTSTFVFSSNREGLGFVNKNNRGFLGHFALAVSRSSGEPPIPLGVVAGRTWIRDKPRKTKGVSQHKLRQSKDCESHRWVETVQELEGRFEGMKSPIHVMDREGDIYDNISTMVANRQRFVVRCMSNRVIESQDRDFHLLFDALDGLDVVYRDTVNVAARKAGRLPDQNRNYPARDGRKAEVCVTATAVCIKRTRNSSDQFPATTSLNVVHVFEPCPPPNQDAVEWILLTNEPISTIEKILSVVACYRQRWLIEELFKAIKTGCIFEKRQLESYTALKNVLAMTLPVAWSMLLLRTQSRSNQDIPAEPIIDPLRLKIIRAHAERYKLPERPTLRDVAYAIAGLGGHLKRNGPPGWITLRRGYEKLLILEEAWQLACQTCDQS